MLVLNDLYVSITESNLFLDFTQVDLSLRTVTTHPTWLTTYFTYYPNWPLTLPKKLFLTEVRILTYDPEFPDLFFFSDFDNTELYIDYMNKKAQRWGLDKNDLLQVISSPKTNAHFNKFELTENSNTISYRGQDYYIPDLSFEERLTLLNKLTYDQLSKYNSLECIRAEHHISTPSRKLQYPEPYIASASFVHTDIGFIHILHYQYWLWFFFIFLIIFFFHYIFVYNALV